MSFFKTGFQEPSSNTLIEIIEFNQHLLLVLFYITVIIHIIAVITIIFILIRQMVFNLILYIVYFKNHLSSKYFNKVLYLMIFVIVLLQNILEEQYFQTSCANCSDNEKTDFNKLETSQEDKNINSQLITAAALTAVLNRLGLPLWVSASISILITVFIIPNTFYSEETEKKLSEVITELSDKKNIPELSDKENITNPISETPFEFWYRVGYEHIVKSLSVTWSIYKLVWNVTGNLYIAGAAAAVCLAITQLYGTDRVSVKATFNGKLSFGANNAGEDLGSAETDTPTVFREEEISMREWDLVNKARNNAYMQYPVIHSENSEEPDFFTKKAELLPELLDLLVNEMAIDVVLRTLPENERIDKAYIFINKLALERKAVYIHEKLPPELAVDVVANIEADDPEHLNEINKAYASFRGWKLMNPQRRF